MTPESAGGTALDVEALRAWTGRTEQRHEVLSPVPLQALGRDGGVALWAANAQGQLAMTARAEWAPDGPWA